MLKKFFAFSLISCLFIVQANASTPNGLKAAFDDLNYALTVEWDQRDRSHSMMLKCRNSSRI